MCPEKPLEPLLLGYFPPALATRFPTDPKPSARARDRGDRITNAMINRGGPAFAVRMADETARPAPGRAVPSCRLCGVRLPDLWLQIDALDDKVERRTFSSNSTAVSRTAHDRRGFMRDGQAVGASGGLDAAIATHAKGAADLAALLDGNDAAEPRAGSTPRANRYDEGVPARSAARIWPSSTSFRLRRPSRELAAQYGARDRRPAPVVLPASRIFPARRAERCRPPSSRSPTTTIGSHSAASLVRSR